MILDKTTNIKIVKSNISYYRSIGFNDIKMYDIITIDIDKLRNGCVIKVNVSCDKCGKENTIYLQKYHINKNNGGFYSCRKCSYIKRISTNRVKYGVDNVSQSKIVKDKKIVTTLSNYGVENPSQSKIVKNKKCKTSFKNYGVNHPLQNINIFEKGQKTAFKRHKYKNVNIWYQSSYELDFLEKYYEKYKDIQRAPTIRYKFEDKQHIYYPDFFIDKLNLIIEIKSDYTYNRYLNKNIEKQKSCLKQGYNFIFIINKNYGEFNKKVN